MQATLEEATKARDALGELWAADVKARREEHAVALTRLGEAQRSAGVPELGFQIQSKWAEMSPADRRSALALFWREIRVGKRDGGGHAVKFIGRSLGSETEVALSTDTTHNGGAS